MDKTKGIYSVYMSSDAPCYTPNPLGKQRGTDGMYSVYSCFSICLFSEVIPDSVFFVDFWMSENSKSVALVGASQKLREVEGAERVRPNFL